MFGYVTAAALISSMPVASLGQTESHSGGRLTAPAGDSPTDAGSLATNLSPKLTRSDIAKAMKLVGDWQLHRLPQRLSTIGHSPRCIPA
jgi:hypothetical protein